MASELMVCLMLAPPRVLYNLLVCVKCLLLTLRSCVKFFSSLLRYFISLLFSKDCQSIYTINFERDIAILSKTISPSSEGHVVHRIKASNLIA